ncbi:hypothetical protein GCM10010472_69250 [Pseudonocardia halophobica]|uniref:SnoaL-like domain-containing protein n=1 Tax=Pseudonocardia halophobica TaxID=29401 RepID=A0A9W6UG80_9PSEU|nr:nuclear transport factor 2 family protein [Pseudonocardia halophobica]GLL15834.1 hypothetical protein GCM10017577_69880 [Pseudonocardia halophobica]
MTETAGRAWPYDPRQGEVETLYARYSFGVDSRDPAVLGACFGEDVRFGTAADVSSGRAATVDRLTGRSVPGTLHTAVNVLATWSDDDSAHSRADFTMLREGRVVASGTYVDRIARVDGVLVFTERVIHYGWREAR